MPLVHPAAVGELLAGEPPGKLGDHGSADSVVPESLQDVGVDRGREAALALPRAEMRIRLVRPEAVHRASDPELRQREKHHRRGVGVLWQAGAARRTARSKARLEPADELGRRVDRNSGAKQRAEHPGAFEDGHWNDTGYRGTKTFDHAVQVPAGR